jgi:hypothetical protein
MSGFMGRIESKNTHTQITAKPPNFISETIISSKGIPFNNDTEIGTY